MSMRGRLLLSITALSFLAGAMTTPVSGQGGPAGDCRRPASRACLPPVRFRAAPTANRT